MIKDLGVPAVKAVEMSKDRSDAAVDVVLRTPMKESESAPYFRPASERLVILSNDAMASFRADFDHHTSTLRAASRSDSDAEDNIHATDRTSVAGCTGRTAGCDAEEASDVFSPAMAVGFSTPRHSRSRVCVEGPPDVRAQHMQAKRRAMVQMAPMKKVLKAKRKLAFGEDSREANSFVVSMFFDGFRQPSMDVGVLG